MKQETEVGTEAVLDIDNKNVIDIDADDHENPFCCAEYAEEIYRYLRIREVQCLTCSPQQAPLGIESFSIFQGIYQVPGNYMKSHKEINTRMRTILVDWLVSVHDKFKLTQETLFLAVSILDRFLAVGHRGLGMKLLITPRFSTSQLSLTFNCRRVTRKGNQIFN